MESIFDSPQFNNNLFYPRTDYSNPPPNTDEIYIDVDDGVQVHARRHPNPGARMSLVFFHGNGEIVSDYDALSVAFADLGVEFTICDYRGYGKSGGIPTLRKVMADAHTTLDHLKSGGFLKDKICIMGRSLGSACAIELCSSRDDITCCIVESGYADPIPLVERRGLRIDKTTPEEDSLFNNSQKIAKIKCPILIMHGAFDQIIASAEAELNFQKAGSEKKYLNIIDRVGHNDIMMASDNKYFSSLRSFLEEIE
ncbi:MAG: alpha/beta hydrolase [Nitrospinales bacterium]